MICKCGNEMEKQWICEQCGERKSIDRREVKNAMQNIK